MKGRAVLLLASLLPALLPARPQPEAGAATTTDQEIAGLESILSRLYNLQGRRARGQGYSGHSSLAAAQGEEESGKQLTRNDPLPISSLTPYQEIICDDALTQLKKKKKLGETETIHEPFANSICNIIGVLN